MKRLLCILLGCAGLHATAQQPYTPTHAEEVQRYKDAAKLDDLVKNKVFNTSVRPHWLAGGQQFWYVKEDANRSKSFYLVDVMKHTNVRLQDTAGLAPDTAKHPHLTEHADRWRWFETDSVSPDREHVAYIKEGNVYVRTLHGEEQVQQFTKDGNDDVPYGALAWSPDGRYLVGYRIHPVQDSSIYYVLSSIPNTTRGVLKSQQYKQPGDPFTTYEMHLFTLADGKDRKVNTEIIDFFDAPVLHWRKGDPNIFLYEKVDRGHQRFRIIEVNAATANTRTILDEQAKTFIYQNRLYTEYLPNTNEIIWTSEKDGWNHIYLVDGITGRVKQQVTKGDYVVKDIDSIDQKKREIWFTASGMNPGEDPYFEHAYRIGFDGQHLVSLTPAAGNHRIQYSPDKKYYLDTYSQVNVAPVTELRRISDGRLLLQVERADTAAFAALHIPLPTPFVAKGRDGVTDIYGIMCVPSRFDSTKQYPVIENIYAGPQDAFVPKSYLPWSEMQSLAELGFIVVQVDGMGTANRSKAFHDVCWKNLADAGFPDRILWMKALARKYRFADSTRIGVYGTSAGGQNAAGAVLWHPEFYKAAVAACGCHDNRMDKQWWNEQWMGYPVDKHYGEQSNITNAAKLQGSLLLIVGEHDENVPPESTYRFADALIKANKAFDLLTVPGMGHSDGGPFGRQRKRDFFVQHLFKILPPDRNAGEL